MDHFQKELKPEVKVESKHQHQQQQHQHQQQQQQQQRSVDAFRENRQHSQDRGAPDPTVVAR